MKLQAVKTAITIAEDFRSQGADVMFLLDSLTRLATAQKEIGLARGEMPGQRGYPTSVQSVIASLLERLGNDDVGSITGIITVLVDGDDLNEPVADTARSILDGHIVLSRELAARNHFPAIDVLNSLSRVYRDITPLEVQAAAASVRKILAEYKEVEDLIQVGLYQSGTSRLIDRAIQMLPAVNRFLQQEMDEVSTYEQTIRQLSELCRNAESEKVQ